SGGSPNAGIPAKPVSTSVMPTREAMATPFHCERPCWATSYPSSVNGSIGNWSSRHLVSCMARTSTSWASSHAATRSIRRRMEFTFQLAIRTVATYLSLPRRPPSVLGGELVGDQQVVAYGARSVVGPPDHVGRDRRGEQLEHRDDQQDADR